MQNLAFVQNIYIQDRLIISEVNNYKTVYSVGIGSLRNIFPFQTKNRTISQK